MLSHKLIIFCLLISNFAFSQSKSLQEHILFYCSFDGKTTADIAVGDAQLYTAESYEKTDQAKPGLHNPDVILSKNKGLAGDALQFNKQIKNAIYFSGSKNLGYSAESWSGSFSFWLQVDPEKDLAKGYCDPINLTDAKFDDAAIWVDFTDHDPRKFRLGVIGDMEIWKQEKENGKDGMEKRIVTVNEPSFGSKKWTHIVITFSEINTNQSVSKLFIDGELQGVVKDVNDSFTWEEENAKIMLGLGYIGLMDELTIFDKPLNINEVQSVYERKDGMKTLFNK